MTKSCFVSIASYRDIELSDTIDSVVSNSTHDLHISIVEQCTKREKVDFTKWESDRVRISAQWMHPLQAKGAGYARHLAIQKYANEDYYLQIDSHTDMIQNWDELLITALNLACKTEKSSKVILSQYPAAYEPHNHVRHKLLGSTRYDPRPLRTHPTVAKRGQLAAKRIPEELTEPSPSTMLLAGYIFGPGEFTQLGYNEHIPFWGEEFYLAINAWMNGWRIYAPHEMYVWHHYGRHYFDKVWDDVDNWTDIEEESYMYLERYFTELMGTHEWTLLHDDHRNTIHEWMDKRRKTRGYEAEIVSEQDIDIEYIRGSIKHY